jgi:hypothetical protein
LISRDAKLTAASLAAQWTESEKGTGWAADTFQLSDVSMQWETLEPTFTGNLVIDWRRYRFDAAGDPVTIIIDNTNPETLSVTGDSAGYTLEGTMGLSYTWGETQPKEEKDLEPDEVYELTLHSLRLGTSETLPDQGQVMITLNARNSGDKVKERVLYEYHFGEYTPGSGWSIMLKHSYDGQVATASYYCNNLLTGTLEPLTELKKKNTPDKEASWDIESLCAGFPTGR